MNIWWGTIRHACVHYLHNVLRDAWEANLTLKYANIFVCAHLICNNPARPPQNPSLLFLLHLCSIIPCLDDFYPLVTSHSYYTFLAQLCASLFWIISIHYWLLILIAPFWSRSHDFTKPTRSFVWMDARRGGGVTRGRRRRRRRRTPRCFLLWSTIRWWGRGGGTNLLGSNIRRFLNLELLALVGTLSVLTRSDDSMDDGFGLPFNPGKTTRYQQ